MSLIRKTKTLDVLITIFITALALLPAPAIAQTPPGCDTGSADSMERCSENYIQDQIRERCAGMSEKQAELCSTNTRSSITSGDFDYDGTPDKEEDTSDFGADCRDGLTKDKCGIVAYIITFINLLTALVGIVSVIMLTIWGIQYSASRDNPQLVASARHRILQTVIAVVIYLFVYAFLQWVVPGGIF